jgi:hypothetical protein
MICCHDASSVELHTTCLQSLHYKGGLPPRKSSFFTVANYQGIKAATIEICENLCSKGSGEVAPLTGLIRQCRKLTYLHLSLHPSMAYYNSMFTSVMRDLRSLTHLSLQGCLPTDHAVRSVSALLVNTRNLEVLSLFPLGLETQKDVGTWYWSDSESDTEPEDGGGDGVDYSSRVTDGFWPTHIRCLDDKLRRINIWNYRGLQLEKMLAKFLLSKAVALEEFSVTLTAVRSQNKSKIAKELRSWRLNHHTRVTLK